MYSRILSGFYFRDIYKDRVRQGRCCLCRKRKYHIKVMNTHYRFTRQRISRTLGKYRFLNIKEELVDETIFKIPRNWKQWKLLNETTGKFKKMTDDELAALEPDVEGNYYKPEPYHSLLPAQHQPVDGSHLQRTPPPWIGHRRKSAH